MAIKEGTWIHANPGLAAKVKTGTLGKAEKNAVAKAIGMVLGPAGVIQNALDSLESGVQSAFNLANGQVATNGISQDTYMRLRYQYSNLYIANALGSESRALDGVVSAVDGSFDKARSELQKSLAPVSSFVGSTFGTLTGMARDPVGSLFELPNTLGAMTDKLMPGSSAKMQATFKALHLENLQNMPSQIYGSIQQIASMINGITAMPIGYVLDIYYGCIELIENINKFISDMYQVLMQFVYGVINDTFPGLMDFLDAVFDMANQIGGIATALGGVNQIAAFTNQIQSYTQNIQGVFQNPLDLIYSYAPPGVLNGINTFQNPAAMINQIIPPEVGNSFAQLSQITGFGFNGNMGYGLQAVLEGFRGGVLQGIASGFSTQFSILAPLFTGVIQTPPSYTNTTTTTKNGAIVAIGTRQKVQINPPKNHYPLKNPKIDPQTGQVR